MRVPRRNFLSRLLVWRDYARWWATPLLAPRLVARRQLRRKEHSTCVELFEIPLYFVKDDIEPEFSRSLLESSLNLLETKTPYWIGQMKKQFRSVIITNVGSRMVSYNRIDKCCMVNSSRCHSRIKYMEGIFLANPLIAVLCTLSLIEGRFGYLGGKHSLYLCFKAEIRFMRKCISSENYLKVLTVIRLAYGDIDKLKLRPDRNYQDFFEQYELQKWNFGKKLMMHPKRANVIIEED